MSDWHGLYSEGWTNEIVPDAFSHPAKFARGLIRRIYEHAVEEGWLAEGDTAVDPFAGVALGGLDAMFHGLHWVGCELEDKFVGLGDQNIALWNLRYGNGMLPRWGTAVILQGDSRYLVGVLDGARAKGIVASPPYVSTFNDKRHGGGIDESKRKHTRKAGPRGQTNVAQCYGQSPGQLAAMPEGDHVKACISSPPYAGGCAHTGGGDPKPEHIEGGEFRFVEYGQSAGQLATLPEGDVRAVISSPPFSPDQPCASQTRAKQDYHAFTRGDGTKRDHAMRSPGNLSLESPQDDTFWSAAKIIVSQCYQVLAPGGHAIWVTKAFVRNKEIVDFPEQWRELCESCGFETLHKHRCWLVEDRGGQYALNGDLVEKRVERKSFFRRLYEKKYPENSIDYEVVWCMRKPADASLFADVAVREGI